MSAVVAHPPWSSRINNGHAARRPPSAGYPLRGQNAVAVGHPFKKSLVITRSNNRAVTQRHHRNRIRVVVRIGNADVPSVRAAVCALPPYISIRRSAAPERATDPKVAPPFRARCHRRSPCRYRPDRPPFSSCTLIVAEQLDVLIADMRQRFINLPARAHARCPCRCPRGRSAAPHHRGRQTHRRIRHSSAFATGKVIAHLGRLTVRVVQLVEIRPPVACARAPRPAD